MDCSLPGSSVHGIFQARITRVGSCSLLHGIFPTGELHFDKSKTFKQYILGQDGEVWINDVMLLLEAFNQPCHTVIDIDKQRLVEEYASDYFWSSPDQYCYL